MTRKLFKFTLLLLCLISLACFPTPATGNMGIVGLRIPAEERSTINSIKTGSSIVIDYGTFLWVTMPATDLNTLDHAGLSYQIISNPYMLTLGGQSFDPLESTPSFDTIWKPQSEESSSGLRLVQFYGPTKEEWLEALEANGLEIVQYIHPFTYVVWGETNNLVQSEGESFIRWSGDFEPAYALLPQNRLMSSDPILVRAMIYPGAGLAETVLALKALGGTAISTVSGHDPVFDLVTFTIPGDKLESVASLPGMYALQPVPTDGGDRGEMSNQVNAGNIDGSSLAYPGYMDWLSHLGLSGEGVVIANVDSGIDQEHTDLASRILTCIGSTCGDETFSYHGTHTAGIMAGDGTSSVTDSNGFLRGLGMAPGANLIEQVYSPTYTYPDGVLTLMTQSFQNGAVISGNSWGPSGSPLGYDADTRLVDIGVRDADPDLAGNQPLTYVLSIMNGFGGTSSQGTPDEAKNIFTIGSTEMQSAGGAQKTNINDLSSNSAHGPALDGRHIPHMVAPGSYVDSTYPGDSFGLMSGTSMASPHVSGAAALFFEQYRDLYGENPSPALVKAAFLPVAHDLAGNHDADGGTLGHPFDSKQGWGRLDAEAVLDPNMTLLYVDQPESLEFTGDTWTYQASISATIQELRVMLVWTDAPGHGLGGATPAWVNDLDLSLSIDGQTYLGNNFGSDGYSITGGVPDGRNNTEGIFISDPPPGTYKLTVTAANISGDGVPNEGDETDQDFALAIYVEIENELNQYLFPIFYR